LKARSGSITNEWKNRWGTIELSSQTTVSLDVSGVGLAALSEDVAAGGRADFVVVGGWVAGVGPLEVVEPAGSDDFPDCASAVPASPLRTTAELVGDLVS